MIGRVEAVRRGAAVIGGGFLAVVALALSIAIAVSSVAPLPADGPTLVASAATVGGTKLPDPQTRARNAWSAALASASRWRTTSSALWGQDTNCLAAAVPWLASAARRPVARPASVDVPRALPSFTYASQGPPRFGA